MACPKLLWLLCIAYLQLPIRCQNARSYDTNEWIPITPSASETKEDEASPKRATGRVLNLESPAQKFFPEDEYLYRKRRPPPQQHHVEQKGRYKTPNKHDGEYKFEVPPQQQQKRPGLQYFPNQEVQLQAYEKPPPPPPRPFPRDRAPSPNAASIYEQYNVPVNSTYYQSLNPTAINRELLGAIQNNPQDLQPQLLPEKIEKETVQLVYVPLENLKPNQQVSQTSQQVYQTVESPGAVQQQARLQNIQQDYFTQALQAQQLQQQIQLGQPLIIQTTTTTSTTTTPKPTKKRKPHQPPLAVYMEGGNSVDIDDVLEELKNAKTIAVQDAIQSGSPHIFIGPSTLEQPEGYSKFPLPYLNSLDGNRIERKVDGLPFFVAPVSYKAPPGFSKILLPSPHVGSVVVSQKETVNDKRAAQRRPTTTRPQLLFDSSTQTLDNQDYYSIGVSTQQQQQPQLVQYALNNNVKQVNSPTESYGGLQTYGTINSGSNVLNNNYYQTQREEKPRQRIPAQQEQFQTDGNVLLTYYPTESGQLGATKEQTPTQKPKQQRIPTRIQQQQVPEESYKSTTTVNQPEQEPYRIPTRTTKQQQSLVSSNEATYNTPSKTTPSARYPSSTSYLKPEVVPITPRATTPTPSDIITNYYVATPSKPAPELSPLDLAINEFELHQINTQLGNKPQTHRHQQQQADETREDFDLPNKPNERYEFDPQLHRFANTPATILRDTHDTTVRPTAKTRRRGRPTKPTTQATREPYTVLEEYSSKGTTPSYTETTKTKYSLGVEEAPANIYTLQTTTGSETTEPSKTKYENVRTEVEQVPARVYSLDLKQGPPAGVEQVSNQDLLDQQVLRHTTPGYEQTDFLNTYYTGQYNDNIEPIVRNRGQNQPTTNVDYTSQTRAQPQEEYSGISYFQNGPEQDQYSSYNQVPDEMSEIVKSLQEQSVRTLLIPNLLAPTGKGTSSTIEFTTPTPVYTPTTTSTTTTTTERAPETTAKPRNRSRTRGGSRYSQAATTTRRSVSRRRPTHPSRTTTAEQEDYQRSGARQELESQRSGTKQRFRTRGRTSPNAASDKVSTTENEIYNGPTSEAVLDYRRQPQSTYAEYDQNQNQEISNRNVVSARPEPEEYHKLYSTQDSPRTSIQYENTATTPKSVRVSESERPTLVQRVSERPTLVQRVSVSESSSRAASNDDEYRGNFKTRGRVRGRARTPPPSTTEVYHTTRRPVISTTPKPQAVAEDDHAEFYGFIRTPNFNQVALATQQPQFYSDSFQKVETKAPNFNPKQELRLSFDNTNTETTTVRFIGEIRPKYPTTTEHVTETSKPRIRARINKTPTRKPADSTPSNHKPTYQEVDEQATRRVSVNRSRGRAHYRLPENLRTKGDEEADVEGGNYPTNFPHPKRSSSTAAPGFQITIEPHENVEAVEEEEDQAPHSSLYNPRVVMPDEWHDASEITPENQGYTSDNKLNFENQGDSEDNPTTTDAPLALPIQNVTEESSVSEETFRENTRAMESLFEAVNNFERTTTTEPAKESRKKGVWKLVRQRPLDHFETAESQNYHSVLNLFEEIKKVPNGEKNEPEQNTAQYDENVTVTDTAGGSVVSATTVSTKPEELKPTSISETADNFFSSFYQMFNMPSDQQQPFNTPTTPAISTDEVTVTTIPPPTFPEEMTEEPTTTTTTTPKTQTDEIPTLSEATKKPYEVEPWEMKKVRTSTSTEVSHETEICYKGRCIKSREKKVKS